VKWFNLSSQLFFAGERRERLQTRNRGFNFSASSMNDFPIPEDPPVKTTAEKGWSASMSEGTMRDTDHELDFPQGRAASQLCTTEPTRRNMNSPNNHELIVSGIHLELTPSLKNFVREKAERLFRHEERIVRIRVELECDRSATVGVQFKAKGHIAIHGPDMNAAVEADECHKAISMLIDKLDRMLQRRHQLHRVKRNHPRAVELESEIPKAVA
jgi:putative sigma-54 modulation protein